MSKIQSLFLAALLACSVVFISPGAYAASAEDDVKAAYAAWDAAFDKADAKAVAAFYADDAVFLPPNHEIIRGPSGVETFFSGLFGGGASGHKLELIEAHGDGSLAYGAAKWSATGKDAEGKDQPWGGVATHVFQRQPDGSLKIMLHTFN
jgi:ketosteroid isomerase-like protein